MSQTPTSEKGIRWGTGWADGQLNVPAKAASGRVLQTRRRGVGFIPASGRKPQGSQDRAGSKSSSQLEALNPWPPGAGGKGEGS